MPVLLSIGTLAASHGTDKFLSYLSALKTVEEMVRGRRNIDLQPSDAETDKEVVEEEEDNTGEVPDPCCPSHTQMDKVCEKMAEGVQPKDDSKFKDLTFRKKLKARGRPKRADRQLCSFNRSQADAVSKPKKRMGEQSHECKRPKRR